MKKGQTIRAVMAVMLVSLCFVFFASSQAHATLTWLKNYTYAGSTRGGALVRTADGGYLQLGMSTGAGLGNWDILAIKLDRVGTIQWQKAFGGMNYDFAGPVLQDTDGGYIISGYADEQSWPEQSKAWIAKLDAQGGVLWQKAYPFAGRASRAVALQKTADNGFIMLAQLITPAYISTNARYDLWLVKLDASGEIEWQKLFDQAQFDRPGSVRQAADGGYFMTGTSSDRVWVVRLDSAGNPRWQKNYDHVASPVGEADVPTDLVLTPDGGCVVSGYARILSPYDNYWWALKLDENGGIQWQKRYNVEHNPNFPVGIIATADSGYVIYGGFSIPTMIKLDGGGNIQWSKRVGNAIGNYVQTVLQEPDGGYIMSSSLVFYSYNAISIVKLDENGTVSGDNSSCRYYSTVQSPASRDVSFAVTDTQVAGAATAEASVEGALLIVEPAVAPATVCMTSAPDIAVSPPSLSLGPVELPGTAEQTLSIANSGPVALEISSITIAGANAAEFSLSGACASVAPGSSCPVAVRFTPAGIGARTASLSIVSNDPDTPTAAVALNGSAVDTIAPATTSMISGLNGGNGWYRSPVTVNLTATDSGSGVRDVQYSVDGAVVTVPGGTAGFTITEDGIHEIAYHATDNAGVAETAHIVSINIDQTPPGISASVSPAPNANGWNSADVTVTFVCSDALSGMVSCPAPITVTTEGAGQTVSGSAVDAAGNTATAAVTVNIDRTAPVVAISAEPSLLWPPNHKMVNVLISGSAEDAGSGLSSVVITVSDEYGTVQPVIAGFNTTIQLEASRKGTDKDGRRYTITAVATDKAGVQTTASTTVLVPHDMGGGSQGEDDDRDHHERHDDRRDDDHRHDDHRDD